MAILEVIEDLHASKKWKALRKGLKKELTSLRDLRDLQNQEKGLDAKQQGNALLQFKKAIKEKRKDEQKKIIKILNSIDFKKKEHAIRTLSEELYSRSKNSMSENRAREKTDKILLSRHHQFEQVASRAKINDPATLHRARIKFKKFRYTWEALEKLYPKKNETTGALKAIQNSLGQIQDHVVLIEFLIEFLVKNKKSHPDAEFLQFLHAVEIQHEESLLHFFSTREETLQKVHPDLGPIPLKIAA